MDSSKPVEPHFKANLGEASGSTLEKVEWRDLSQGRRANYGDIKKTFKAEAMGSRKGFVLSELVASQLSVEEEEKNRFEKRVGDELEKRLSLIKAEASQKGFQQGEEQGKAKAFEEEKARLAALQEKLAMTIQDISHAKTHLSEQYENDLLNFSFRIAEVILHNHIDEKPECVKNTVRAILDRISRDEDVRVKLSTHSFEGIAIIDKEIQAIARDGRITFELDPTLIKGACVVESQSGEYASFIDDKLQVLKKEFLDKRSPSLSASNEENKAG